MALGWADVDPFKNYELNEPVIERNNKYAQPFVLRADLIYRVTQFGYKQDDIMESMIENKATHDAATYYLLEKDHDHI